MQLATYSVAAPEPPEKKHFPNNAATMAAIGSSQI
jgi:hypothetical protein